MRTPPLRRSIVLAVFAVVAVFPAAAADTASLVKADRLKAEPFLDAKTVSTLAAGDRVEILKRQGGWFQVKCAKGSGWVRMLSVRRGEVGTTNLQREATGLLGLASGRAGTGNIVSTTGIRGLNEEQLKAAKFSEAELKLSDTFVRNAEDARKFAAARKLVPRKLDYLSAPASVSDRQ